MKTISTLLLISAMSVAVASAQPGRGDGPGAKGERPGGADISRMADELDLTKEQRQEVKSLRQEWQKQQIDLRAAAQKARLAVQHQMGEEQVRRDEIMKAIEAEGAAELALKQARVEYMLKVREIVGPEKAKRMMEMRQDNRRGDGPDNRRDGRGDGPRKDRGDGPRGDRGGYGSQD